jgi:hypothetical protein
MAPVLFSTQPLRCAFGVGLLQRVWLDAMTPTTPILTPELEQVEANPFPVPYRIHLTLQPRQ